MHVLIQSSRSRGRLGKVDEDDVEDVVEEIFGQDVVGDDGADKDDDDKVEELIDLKFRYP